MTAKHTPATLPALYVGSNHGELFIHSDHDVREPILTADTGSTDEMVHEIARRANEYQKLEEALRHVLLVGEKLSDWMREHTGPADGTLYLLTDWHEMRQRERALLRSLGEE